MKKYSFQMSRLIIAIFILIICFSHLSCQNSLSNSADYATYINNPQNGICKLQSSENFIFTLKYLPPEYLAIKEIEECVSINEDQKDSILNSYRRDLTFLFSVSSLKDNGNENESQSVGSSLLYRNLKDAFLLQCDDESFHPILATSEFTGGLSDKLNFYLVFRKASDSLITDKISIVFFDRYFDSIEKSFQFDCDDLNKIPKLNSQF